MKLDNKIFICALLALILLLFIGATSANDTLEDSLATNATGDELISVSEAEDTLSEGNTIIVDGGGNGKISQAVSSASGGDTVYIKNGEYTEDMITFTKSLNIVGESQDGVIIKKNSGNTELFVCADNYDLTFTDFSIKDSSKTGGTGLLRFGAGNINWINCTFDNLASKYGAMQYSTTGTVNIEDCTFTNVYEYSSGSGTGAIYISSGATVTINNCLFDNCGNQYTSGQMYGLIYHSSRTGSLAINATTFTNTYGTANSIIRTQTELSVRNSRIYNNTVQCRSGTIAGEGIFYVTGSGELTVEQCLIANNTLPKYLVYANTANPVTMNYNNIYGNDIANDFSYDTTSNKDYNYNYWGEEGKPSDVPDSIASITIIKDGDTYKLSNGEELNVIIPGLNDDVVDPNTTFVSPDGDDANDGSQGAPVKTIAKAVELANAKNGQIIIAEGTYSENNIVLDSDVIYTITGKGNVVIDGTTDENSIFVMHGGQATFTNIRFTNNKAKYGSAIFINYETGTSRTTVDINVTVDKCTFEDLESTSRGGAIYAWYTTGNLIIKGSTFKNINGGSYGAVTAGFSAFDDGLNVEISDSTFDNNFANNGAAAYLQAKTVTITNSVFANNTASYGPGAIFLYNGTATIDNCKIYNNSAVGSGAAIHSTMPSSAPVTTVTITNSIIENNYGTSETLPAIYVDMNIVDISYSSLINDLSVETRTASSYDGVYGQGVAIVNNNWWGTADPSNKVKGKEITLDKWVIMNVEANASEVVLYDEVKITVDFNHVNTTSGEIEELTGGVIPVDSFTVNFAVDNGTITPQTIEVLKGASNYAIYEVADPSAIVTVSCGDVETTLDFSAGEDPYFGVIYLSKEGSDDNNGSESAPVASLGKAIALALNKHGSGEIIVSEGTYNGTDFAINRNLTITGVGKVTFNGEDKTTSMFNIASGAGVGKLELNNLIITNVARGYGAFVYNYGASEVILDNITFVGNTNTNVRFITTNVGTLTIKNSVMSNNTLGGIICHSGAGNLTIINSTFENNIVTKDSSVYALVFFSSGTGAIIIEDCLFKNNTVRQNVVYSSSGYSTPGNDIYMKNTEISDTKSDMGYGAAIRAQAKLVVDNSVFRNNKAYRDGGAIYIDSKGDATITNSVFIGNQAGSSDKGDIIANKGKLTINYCVLLNDYNHKTIFNAGEYSVNAQYNWWGTNDDPKYLNAVDRYYDWDEYEYVNTEYPDTSNWIVMNVTSDITGPIKVGDNAQITVDFTKYMDSTGKVLDLTKQLPEFTIAATSNIGELDANEAVVKDGIAKFTYTATEDGHDTVNIISGLTVPVDINVYVPGAVYVSATGSDDNNGSSEENAVASIAKAIELAEAGKIIILDGTYTIDSTLIVDKDMDIRGKGTVTIDGNSTRILENTANLNLTNIAFTNAKLGFASAILDDGNTIITNCTFYSNRATATSSGNIINNRKGTMVIDDCKFYENVASRGVIGSQSGTNLLINNSEFYNNDMTSLSTTYGMIYSNSADTVIENTVFRNNKVKTGGAIYATRATSSTTGVLEVTNCTFENNTAYQGQGGAIFAGRTPTIIKDSTFTNNQAISGSYAKGQGGAIYQTIDDPNSSMSIDNCIFVNNTAGDTGSAFYVNTNQGTFAVSNSIILNKEGDTTAALAKKDGATTEIIAENNYWGNNTDPSSDAPVEVLITLDVTINPADAQADDEVTITATFSQDMPEGIELTFTSTSNKLNENVAVIGRTASVTYTLDPNDHEVIISLDGVELERIPFNIPDVIYVLPGASDSGYGTIDDPVGTIERALKLAVKGNIVLLEGTHKVSDLGIISSDLNITGNGTVIIDAQNNNRILYVGSDAKVVISNVVMVNGYTPDGSGALLGNSNELTLINCTLANSSAGTNNGGAIYNVGKLTIINSTIANNTAREGGAIFTNDAMAKGASIIIENSAFENNVATGNENLGGGAIFAQQVAEFTITNASFINNEAQTKSSGGAIFISHSEATIKITDSEFISNFAKGQSDVGGGAIYMVGTSNYERKGVLDITNTLFDSNIAGYDGGAIYVRATTLKIANSVLIDNADQNGYAIFGYGTEQVNPSITANDNWWGSNDNPKDNIGGYRFTPSVSRWAIMTITNASELKAGENVLLTVSLNNYTTGTENGTLEKPITISVPVTIKTSTGDIEGVLENGEFTTEYAVPEGLKYISATLNDETVVLYVVPTETIVEISDVTAKQGERVTLEIKVVAKDGTIINSGHVELYIGDKLMANIEVIDGKASDVFMISEAEGIYNLTAKFVDETLLFTESNATATLNVSGINNIVTQENFFDFFTSTGVIVGDLPFNELIFQGDFKELGIDVITFNKPVSIVGDEAVLNNIAISVSGNDVELNNITLIADADFTNNDGAVILVKGSDAVLNNVVVNYTVPDDTEGFGIYAYEASGFTLTNSKIIFDGNNLNGDVKNHALRIWECDDAVIKGNLINATLPSVNCDWSAWGTMDTDLVLAVGIQAGENILFTENQVFSNVKAAASGYPTLDTIIVYGATDIVISHNNITETDFTGQGIPGYSYCVDLYSFNGATVEYNNIYVKTSTGIEGAGTAYCVQATGPYTGLVVDHNNITAIGAGPALGIYSQNYDGQTEITVTNNYINVTGLATGSYYALVSGMELQDTVAKIYNNTIYSYNVGDGTDGLFGISYAQSTGGRHYYDIQNNTVVTEGAYAIYFMSARDSTVKNNILYADELVGDDAAMIGGGSGNVVENNYPALCNITVEATDVFEGQATTVTVTVPDATGSVTIRVNNKEYTVDLIDGVAVKEIEDYGSDFNVEATYNGDFKYLSNTNSTTFKVIDNIVNPDEFYAYFEADGSLKSAMPYDVLIFNGTFENFPYIVIKKSVTLKGGDSVFYNFGIVVKASDVTVDNFTISITVDEDDAIVISAVNVDDVTITNNNLYLESHITDDTFDANAINLDRVSGATVLNNTIYTSLPALFASNYDMENFMMGLNTVNPVRIRNSEDVVFKFNDVSSYVNDVSASYPTIQCLFVVGSKNVLIDSNNFTMDDNLSPLGTPVYLYAINFGYDEKTTISNNNFYISTLSGQDSAGSAYALQGVESELNIIGNNITTISNGPNLGIYVASMMGGTSQLYIEGNTINVTGYAVSSQQWALVSGIEITNGVAKIYNNTINTHNKAGYVEIAPVHGISYAQYMYGDRSIDAQGNTIFTEGKYTVSVLEGALNVVNNYLIAHDLKGDASVNGAGTVKDNLPTKANLIVSVEDITVGQDATIDISIDERVSYDVYVLVNGKNYVVGITDGKGQVKISDLSVGKYSVVATYPGDYYILEDENSTTFNVDKIASELTITLGDIAVGEDVNVTVTVPGVAGDVTIYVDGVKVVLPLTDGSATYTIPSIDAGNHSVTAVYLGDKTHSIATNTTKFTVEKLITAIEVPSIEINAGETAEFDIVLSENATGTVLVKVGGKTILADIEDGIAHVSISGLGIGTYDISAIYTGDDIYAEAENNTAAIKVNALDSGLSANASNIVVGENATINIEINDEITEGVKVVLGDNEYPAVLTDGKAIVSIPDLANGTYTATVIFAGNEKFAAKEVEVTFTVGKKEIPGDINVTMDIPEGTTSPEFTVNLPADATGNFTVTVDGKNYTAPVVNGSATVKVPDLTVGNHTISSSYSGDDNYDGFTSDNQTINIPKASIPGGDSVLDPTTPEGSDSPSYTITLPGDATGNLTVTVDGVNYTAPLVNGTATVTVPKLAPGDHNITVTYTGDEKYSSISKSTTYNVKEPVVKLVKPKDITMLYTAKTPYKVRVMIDGKAVGAGEVVTIKFNGKTYNVKTDKNGYATLKLPDVKPKKAKYTITAEYKGVKVTNKVKVNSVIKAKNAKIKKSKKVNKIKVTLKKVNGKAIKGKTLKLKIKGKTVKAKTNKKGKAVFKLKKKVVKKLKVGKKYKYTVTFGKDKVTKKIKVKK